MLKKPVSLECYWSGYHKCVSHSALLTSLESILAWKRHRRCGGVLVTTEEYLSLPVTGIVLFGGCGSRQTPAVLLVRRRCGAVLSVSFLSNFLLSVFFLLYFPPSLSLDKDSSCPPLPKHLGSQLRIAYDGGSALLVACVVGKLFGLIPMQQSLV